MIAHATSPRVVLAKIGLDGHDRGVKVVARGLRDAGFHVIYAGLWQPIEAVVQTALDEDADWLGISLLSGAHMTLVPPLMEQLRKTGLEHVGVLIGGIIPEKDVPKLLELGVRSVAGPGTTIAEIVERLHKPEEPESVEDLVRRFRQKDRRALARLLTIASRGQSLDVLRHELASGPDKGRVTAFTGSGGVGKSSLIGRSVELLRSRDRSVAVLCCDPESPLTGGALLGDRLRIAKPADDSGVFIRSLATPGGQQAIAKNLDVMVGLLGAFGFDTVILETVGAGQGDTAVREQSDVLVVLLQPESGDELQWEKAGLLEVADIVVVHKADLPGSDRMAAQVHEHLNLPGARPIPVLKASAAKGQGLEELWAKIEEHQS
ncbi:MAG TPA: cobalamin-dependent protein [Planctomycetaceae bacterium]|nr:cobalamin-dependent protein [Planctomycetaceae bacterium]